MVRASISPPMASPEYTLSSISLRFLGVLLWFCLWFFPFFSQFLRFLPLSLSLSLFSAAVILSAYLVCCLPFVLRLYYSLSVTPFPMPHTGAAVGFVMLSCCLHLSLPIEAGIRFIVACCCCCCLLLPTCGFYHCAIWHPASL